MNQLRVYLIVALLSVGVASASCGAPDGSTTQTKSRSQLALPATIGGRSVESGGSSSPSASTASLGVEQDHRPAADEVVPEDESAPGGSDAVSAGLTLWASSAPGSAGTGSREDDPAFLQDVLVRLQVPDHGVTRVHLLPGVYTPFRIRDIHGTSDRPVVFSGAGRDVVVTDGSFTRTAAIGIDDSSHVHLQGVVIENALFGVMVTGSSEVELIGLEVRDVGQEGIHVRGGSHDVLIEGNVIHDTGRRTDAVGSFSAGQAPGEGIYIGTGGDPKDEVWNVVIRSNEIYATSHEAIDVKVPAHHILIEDNHIHDVATFTSGALVVHIDDGQVSDAAIHIVNNRIHDVTTASEFRDGNCIVVGVAATVQDNVLSRCEHRGVFVYDSISSVGDRTVTISGNRFDDQSSIGVIDVRDGSTANVVKFGNHLVPGRSDG